jgi:hypothetical protein
VWANHGLVLRKVRKSGVGHGKLDQHMFPSNKTKRPCRRWYTKHPLHLSASSTPSSPPLSITTSTSTPKRVSEAHSSSQHTSEPLAASILAADPPESAPESSFTTALSMLLYGVSYLAYTQTIDVPLSQAGDVLSNLWTVCCSPELGR